MLHIFCSWTSLYKITCNQWIQQWNDILNDVPNSERVDALSKPCSSLYIAHLIQECHNSKLSIFHKSTLNVLKVLTYTCSEMKDIKYPPVVIIKGIIDVPFILIERAFSVPFYALLNSKTVVFELGHFWIKWAIY